MRKKNNLRNFVTKVKRTTWLPASWACEGVAVICNCRAAKFMKIDLAKWKPTKDNFIANEPNLWQGQKPLMTFELKRLQQSQIVCPIRGTT